MGNSPQTERVDLKSLLAQTGWLEIRTEPQLRVGRPCKDSREVGPGSCYFAIKGRGQDGHDFIRAALESGAAAVVTDQPQVFHALNECPSVLVSSSRDAYASACSTWFKDPSSQLRLVGVTGTNGKTTTTFLLRQIWDSLAIESGLIGTIGYWVGQQRAEAALTTPDSFCLQSLFEQMARNKIFYGALEVSSIALDQSRLLGTHFQVGIFTNLTQDHLDYHGTMEDYFSAKQRFFGREFQVPIAIFNLDDSYGRRLYSSFPGKGLGFSLQKREAEYFCSHFECSREGIVADLVTPFGNCLLKMALLGRHNLANGIGVLAACDSLGLPRERVLEALRFAKGAPGRLEQVAAAKSRPQIFVDYAHTPDALLNVLSLLKELLGEGEGRLITVVGCGGDRDRTKRAPMAQVATRWSDLTVLTSDNPRTEDPEKILEEMEEGVLPDRNTQRVTDRREAIGRALSQATEKDMVIVAGKGHEDYQILGKRRVPFDDRQVILEYYQQCSAG